jgi:hypothetical protein
VPRQSGLRHDRLSAPALRLIWTTDLLPHALAAKIRIRIEPGAVEMKQAIEAGARLNR